MDTIKELPKVLSDIDVPFKISAGPGAGKTTWLVEHVKNVLINSDKLNKTQKVACITHTRIGADTVNKKIKNLTDTSRLDIGTIHSFLYRNIIKPFAFLIEKDTEGKDFFNISELSGHIEHRPNYNRISSWKAEIEKDNGKKYAQFSWPTNKPLLISKLRCIEFALDSEGSINIEFSKKAMQYRIAIPTLNRELIKYKKTYWKYGIMHHEDVLFFTHYIFNHHPRVIEFISNKFPYLFLDEFQDTTPLQTWIINKISSKNTIVGVIGDPAQSIFKFAGASREDFNNFTLPEIQRFKKSHNFRSTYQIIDFLKHLRNDIEQIPGEKAVKGEQVVMFVGDVSKAQKYIQSLGDQKFSILCRSNKHVNILKNNLKKVEGDNLINLLYSEDSDHKRPRFIHTLIKAYDFNENGEYKEAIKELKKQLLGANIGGLSKRRLAIEILNYLKINKTSYIVDIYKYWQKELKKHSVILKGLQKAKDVHNKSLEDLLPFLSKQTKISSKIRTIHQAKGDEFNNVLLCLFNNTDKNGKITKKVETILKNHIFDSKKNIVLDSDIGEETRLFYVACSRAKNNLFINVPTLSKDDEFKMKKLGVLVDRKTTDLCAP
jgi:DNA helicase-2/ATP-dependent DNA helicase PcrA